MLVSTTLAISTLTLGFIYSPIFDIRYLILVGPALLLGLWAQWRVKSTFGVASQMPAESGISGAEAAKMILQAHGITNVTIEGSHGMLSDHYDPKAKVIRLSEPVLHSRSVAAIGIAAHEAGHAVQDAQHYAPLKLRNGIVPFAAVGGNLGLIIVIVGLVLGGAANALGFWIVWAGIGLFSLTVLFQLINLPVEFDASKRAKDLMQSTGIVASGGEARAMNKVLNAAALTYVAATLASVGTLLYYVLLAMSGSRREE